MVQSENLSNEDESRRNAKKRSIRNTLRKTIEKSLSSYTSSYDSKADSNDSDHFNYEEIEGDINLIKQSLVDYNEK